MSKLKRELLECAALTLSLLVMVLASGVQADEFERFRYRDAYYAWALVPTNMLAVTVPYGVHPDAQVYDETGTNVVRQKTYGEFVFPSEFFPGTNLCLTPISHMEEPTLRKTRTTRDDLAQHAALFAAYTNMCPALMTTNWLDRTQVQSIKAALTDTNAVIDAYLDEFK